MTREEAIEILSNTSFFGRSADDIDTALEMAIECLSAQNEAMTEEELAEFKKELASAVPKKEKETDTDGQIYHISLVTDLPKEEKGEMKHIYCPKCGFKMDIIKPISNLFNFCPWCASYVEKRGDKE